MYLLSTYKLVALCLLLICLHAWCIFCMHMFWVYQNMPPTQFLLIEWCTYKYSMYLWWKSFTSHIPQLHKNIFPGVNFALAPCIYRATRQIFKNRYFEIINSSMLILNIPNWHRRIEFAHFFAFSAMMKRSTIDKVHYIYHIMAYLFLALFIKNVFLKNSIGNFKIYLHMNSMFQCFLKVIKNKSFFAFFTLPLW